MTATPEDKATRGRGLNPGHWIAIATIAVVVLGGVLGWALSEHNARLANVESAMNNIAEAQARFAEAQARVEGEIKAVHERLTGFEERLDERLTSFEERLDERLDRIETQIDRLIQLHSL